MEVEQPRTGRLTVGFFIASTTVYTWALFLYVPILPVYVQQTGASHTVLGLVIGAYGAVQLVLRLPLGIVSDRLGRRKPFILLGVAAAAVGAIGFVLGGEPWLLVASRAVTGVSVSTWVVFTVLFASYFPPALAVRAMSLLNFFIGLASVLATYVGGRIAEDFGLTVPFYIGAGLAVVGLVMFLGLPEERRPTAGTPRRPGSALGIVTMPLLLVLALTGALNQYALYNTTYTFSPVYAAGLGATSADQGLLVAANLLPSALAMLAATWLADRFGERAVVAGGMTLAGLAIFSTPFVGGFAALIGVQALNGAGLGLAFPVLMGLSIRACPVHERATAMGLFQAFGALGKFAGPVVGGLTADVLGLASVFFTTSALCLAAAVLALVAIAPKAQG